MTPFDLSNSFYLLLEVCNTICAGGSGGNLVRLWSWGTFKILIFFRVPAKIVKKWGFPIRLGPSAGAQASAPRNQDAHVFQSFGWNL